MRKNNFINNQNINTLDQSPMSTGITNFNSITNNTSGERKMNNTNNLGLSSEASMSQTRHGITQLLSSLNSTTAKNNETMTSTIFKDTR
jgi:hypothetical protein